MCGIAGFVGHGSLETLRRMTRAIEYRGPDGEGTAIMRGGYVGLGHRRLAIIDIESGSQPIYNEDGSVAVVFNGEIYNYRSLRASLEGRHIFRTNSDTEVIVHLYEEKGVRFVEDLRGMFAIAIWDDRESALILARDRFGEKPLYYADLGDTFLFGSEPKALLSHPLMRPAVDMDAARAYFLHEYVPAPRTIYAKMQKLPAAHILKHADESTSIDRYWSILDHDTAPAHETNTLEALDARLDEAVRMMLVSDVPLGVWLSGGLDSSTVAYYAQKNSAQKIRTFSIGFAESSFDESGFAARAAARIGTDHTCTFFSADDLIRVIPEIYARLDEPLADPSLIPTYLLAESSRKSVTVALGGDGSDELLFGYPTFQADKLAEIIGSLPTPILRAMRASVGALPTSFKYMSTDFKLKRFLAYADRPWDIRNQLWIGAFDDGEIARLFIEPFDTRNLFDTVRMESMRSDGFERQARLSHLYLTQYLQDDILVKSDRASMFNSLEVRAPFLDHALASWIFSLPAKEKMRGFQTKNALKRLMAPRIGRDLAYRKKQGFQPPVARWLNNELLPLVRKHLNTDTIAAQGIFNHGYIDSLIREHARGHADNRKKLWSLLVFQLWREQAGI